MTDPVVPLPLHPIGVIRSPHRQATGTPIQPCAAANVEGTVVVFPGFAAGLADLAGFARLWLLFWMHHASPARMSVVPYRDSRSRGLFATRAPARPNPIGMSAVRLLAVEGCCLRVAELDILDGSPLIDIKPYIPQYDSYPDIASGWLEETDVLRRPPPPADDRFERPH